MHYSAFLWLLENFPGHFSVQTEANIEVKNKKKADLEIYPQTLEQSPKRQKTMLCFDDTNARKAICMNATKQSDRIPKVKH